MQLGQLPPLTYSIYLLSSKSYYSEMQWNLKRMGKWAAGISLVAVIVSYAYLKSIAILEGPKIRALAPLSGTTATSSLMEVSGRIDHAKEITLDGRPIFIDLEGKFAEKLLLADGYNIIEVVARDAQGREDRKTIELMYRSPETRHTVSTSTSDAAAE